MTDRCVYCGAIIPEGRRICSNCVNKLSIIRPSDTDARMVSVEDVLDTIRDMAHHPDHVFRAQDLLDELERRLMK